MNDNTYWKKEPQVPDGDNILIWTSLYKAIIFPTGYKSLKKDYRPSMVTMMNVHLAVKCINYSKYRVVKNRMGRSDIEINRTQLEDIVVYQFESAYANDIIKAKKAWNNGLRGQGFTWALQINDCDLDFIQYAHKWLETGCII